jgi:DNA-directed RNA polymerase specialized sigma24 family protein
MQEQEFIDQLRNGDARAFERLVDELQSKVFNTCLSFVFDRNDAEDLTQEVFV